MTIYLDWNVIPQYFWFLIGDLWPPTGLIATVILALSCISLGFAGGILIG